MQPTEILARAQTRACTSRRVAAFDRGGISARLFCGIEVHGDFRIVEQVARPSAETCFDVCTDGTELFVSVLYREAGEYFGTGVQTPAGEGAGNHVAEVLLCPCCDGIGFLQFGAGPGTATWFNHHWPYRDGRTDLSRAPRWHVTFEFQHLGADLAWIAFFRFHLADIVLPGYDGPLGFNVMRTQLRHNESATWNHAAGSGFPDGSSCGVLHLSEESVRAYTPLPMPVPKPAPALQLCGTYDWPDEMVGGPYTPETARCELRFLKAHGLGRIYFIDYPHWLSMARAGRNPWPKTTMHVQETLKAFGGDFMPALCRLAHEEGLEFYTVCKPYDLQAGDPYVAAHPEHCFRRNPAWCVGNPAAPLTELCLYADSDAPLTFDPARIGMYESDDNLTYAPVHGVQVTEDVVERPCVAYTPAGNQPVGGGERVRRIRLAEFAITGRYAAVAFPAAASSGGFGNREFLLVEADRPVALSRGVRDGDFTRHGFSFDRDGGSAVWADRSEGVALRRALPAGCALGLFFGHDESVQGMLDPSHPEVRRYWVDTWVRRAIAVGADGVDIRIAHHHENSEWLAYMYAEPVMAAFRAQYGREPAATAADYAAMRRLRGAAHTQFLREAKAVLAAAGRRLEVHVEARMKTPPEHDTYTQIHWDYATWIDDGIVDGVNLKYLGPLNPFVQREIVPRARRRGIPVTCIAAVGDPRSQPRTPEWHREWVDMCRLGGIDGLNLYELWVYLRTTPRGAWFPRGCSRAIFAELKAALEA